MKKKKWLKTVNRGVLLTLLVVITLVGYVVIGNALFESKHKKNIEDTANRYLTELTKINLASENQKKNGYLLTTEEQTQLKQKLVQLRDDFWSDRYQNENVVADYYYGHAKINKDTVNKCIDTIMNFSEKKIVLFDDFQGSFSNVRIRKNSPSTAIMEADLTIRCSHASGLRTNMLMTILSGIGNSDSMEDATAIELLTQEVSGSVTFEMVHETDGWKIISIRTDWMAY